VPTSWSLPHAAHPGRIVFEWNHPESPVIHYFVTRRRPGDPPESFGYHFVAGPLQFSFEFVHLG